MTLPTRLAELRAIGDVDDISLLDFHTLIDAVEAAAAYRFWQPQTAIIGAAGMAEKYKRELYAALARLGGGE